MRDRIMFNYCRHPVSFLSWTLLLILGLGCARSFNPDIERGSNYKFQEGFPEARSNAVGFINEDGEPGISVAVDVVKGSLVFVNRENQLAANFAIDIQVIEAGGLNRVVQSERYTRDVTSTSQSIVYDQSVISHEERIPAPAGTYDVNITVTDLNSNKQITRVSQTSIPDPDQETIDLTNIRMLAKDLDRDDPVWMPVTTYDVPMEVDSVKFIFQVVNSPSDTALEVNTRLIRFNSDTQPARAMYHNNYGSSSLIYKGIEVDEYEELQSSQRTLRQAGSVLVELKFARQERGNYRFEARTARTNSGGDEILKGRDFGVKSENYPAVQSPEEMARPLVYLMDDGDHDRLLRISHPDSLKAAVDRFWLRNVGDQAKARNVIRMYYERVEEANKLYSNYKEGWKTDRGMIYILYGPPWYEERNLDRLFWAYSYNRNDPRYNFTFVQRKLQSEYYPFEHYILQRSSTYYDTYYQQLQLWLTGTILTRSI